MVKNKEAQDFLIILDIVERASKKGYLMFDSLSLSMDLEFTHKQFNLRLQELLKADDFNFAHDIIGIQNNLNRQTKQMENYFVPRYASF